MAETNKRKRDDEDVSPPGEPALKAQKNEGTTTDKPFRFLDLPAGLRNNVYEKSVKNESVAYLSNNKRYKHYLRTKNGLLGVSKQVRREFKGIFLSDVRVIKTQVLDFNFNHIITYIDRLRGADLFKLWFGQRVKKIEFVFSDPSEDLTLDEVTGFRRWQKWLLTRNKVSAVHYEYEHASDFALRLSDKYEFLSWLDGFADGKKIRRAMLQSRASN